MERNIDSEKLVEKKLTEAAKNKGGLCLKFMPQFFNGFPDRMILLPGAKIFFAEIKTTKQKPRKLQLFVHDKLRKLGFDVRVIDTVEKALTIIDEYTT